MPAPSGYSRIQIRLHWIIAFLIVLQFVLHEPIAKAWDAIEAGQEFTFSLLIPLHVFGGLLILALAAWRISVRAKRGAPALPEKEPAPLKIAAHITHFALYAMMVLMPVSGAVAWFGGQEGAADAHEAMKALLLLFFFLHVAGALFQQFVLKTNIMDRMKRPD